MQGTVIIYFYQYDMKLYLAEIAAWLPVYCDFSFEHSAVLTQLHCFQFSANFFWHLPRRSLFYIPLCDMGGKKVIWCGAVITYISVSKEAGLSKRKTFKASLEI